MNFTERLAQIPKDWAHESVIDYPFNYHRVFRVYWSLLLPGAPKLHAFDWKDEELLPDEFQGVTLTTGLSKYLVQNRFQSFMASDLGRWDMSYLLKVVEPESFPTEYMQIGFVNGDNSIRMSQVKFNPRQTLRTLVGPYPTTYGARSKEGLWLPLESEGPYHRNDPEFQEFLLI